MDKNMLIGLGLVGLPFMIVGVGIGGIIMGKIDDKFNKREVTMFKDLAEFFKDRLIHSYEENEKLREKYWKEISRKENEEEA